MKLIKYSIIGLFIISLVFVAGNSFAQLVPYESAPAQRFDPFIAGMSPSDRAWLTSIYGLGPKLSVTLYGQPSASDGNLCEASTMISSELKTPQGGYLAEISDLVIHPENGRITDVVLTHIRGMGAKEVVAPFSTVLKNGELIFLYSAPQEVYQFHREASSESFTARRLIGSTVKTSKGEDLGRINDLVIDHMGGHVVGLVVSGKEGKLVNVPFSALSKSGDTFILKTT